MITWAARTKDKVRIITENKIKLAKAILLSFFTLFFIHLGNIYIYKLFGVNFFKKFSLKTPDNAPEISLNEPFILNYDEVNISMVIYNATKEDKIILNGEERTSEGVFIKVNGALINLIKFPVNIGISVFIIDSQNNSYTNLGYNLGEGPLQPNLRREIFYIFEVPKEATGLKFLVAEDKKHLMEIDLGI